MNKKRKVCVVLVDRANYGRLQPAMLEIQRHPALELVVIAAGTMVLERFDRPVRLVERDGFEVVDELYVELEGSTLTTMARSVGMGIVEFSNCFRRVAPDVVLVIGDRYEALSAAIAAAYMNLPILHLQGGEVSGSIDESARHAISKFAHYHFPATRRSADYLVRMGERPDTILGVGCPSSDLARTFDRKLTGEILNRRGAGAQIDPDKPFLLVVFHPTTTEYGGETRQIEQLLGALHELRRPTLLLWPNIDAGSDHISKAIRVHRSQSGVDYLRTLTNLPPDDYLRVLASTACAVGNSSSFVRDAGYFGTPVVLVGNRQDGRERDAHVTQVAPELGAIAGAIRAQLAHGRYAPSTLYGDGHVAPRIAKALAELRPYAQKRLAFTDAS